MNRLSTPVDWLLIALIPITWWEEQAMVEVRWWTREEPALSGFNALRLASIFCFVALNAADILTTSVGFRLGFSEGNSLMAAVLAMLGEEGMYTIKLLVVWVVVAAMVVFSARYGRLWYALHTMNAVLAIVVVSNLAAVLGD